METLTPEQLKQLEAKIAEFGTVRFPPPYWFDEEPDETYCLECAEKIVKEHPVWQRDGGWGIEDDNVVSCGRCNRMLEHDLTDYGIGEEMAYADEHGVDLSDDDVRYTLVNISQATPLQNAEWLYRVIFGKQTKQEKSNGDCGRSDGGLSGYDSGR